MIGVKILTRINEPYEILEQSTSKGKFIWKKFVKINNNYQDLKDAVKVTKDKIILYIYSESKMSLTSDLSNEILYENPEKFIIIGREKSGEVKCSLRSAKYPVLTILNEALKDVNGYGGGHLHACGANIKKEDFDQFLDNVRKQL
jgi:single-stranded DNA-specific DHH superfamily exonuclease